MCMWRTCRVPGAQQMVGIHTIPAAPVSTRKEVGGNGPAGLDFISVHMKLLLGPEKRVL